MTFRFDDWSGTFERCVLRDAGGASYEAREMRAQKQRPLYGEAE